MKELCKCECHNEGAMIMHCFPCCDYCDKKYLDKNGKVIEDKLPKEFKKENK